MKRLLATLLAVPLLVAVAPAADASSPRGDNLRHAASIAIRQVGDPYVYGGAGPNSFDCSGLTSYALHKAGLRGVARTAAGQQAQTRRIPQRKHRRGDLVFYGSPAYHVAMFVGKGRRVVEAQTPGSNVKVTSLWTAPHTVGTYRHKR